MRVLEKVSSTIDKNEERCEETDRKDQHELEWKQVALVIGNITTTNHKYKNIQYLDPSPDPMERHLMKMYKSGGEIRGRREMVWAPKRIVAFF